MNPKAEIKGLKAEIKWLREYLIVNHTEAIRQRIYEAQTKNLIATIEVLQNKVRMYKSMCSSQEKLINKLKLQLKQ